VAARPKQTRINTVKIKPGVGSIPEHALKVTYSPNETHAPQGGIGEGLLDSAGRETKDGVHSVAVGYGTMGSGTQRSQNDGEDTHGSPKSQPAENNVRIVIDNRRRANSTSTLGSLHSIHSQSPQPVKKRTTARSGSITENFVDMGGVKKMVLETTSSSDAERSHSPGNAHADKQNTTDTDGAGDKAHAGGKKKRKKRAAKKKKCSAGESAPLLGGDRS